MRRHRRDAAPAVAGVRSHHRWVLVAAVLAAVGGSVAFAAAVPPYGSADEAAHVDYALQVWHGQLPVFEDGLELQLDQGARPPVQWTAQHPPAFYLLLAPVVGPLVDGGHPVQAAFAGRAVTAVLAALAVLAVGWAARWVVGRPGTVAVAAAAVSAADVWVLRLGGAVYNDILQVLVVTLLLGMAARVIRLDGVSGLWWTAWLVLPLLAVSTRASGIPIAALALAVVAVAALRSRRPVRALAGRVLLPLLVAVGGAGWFYLRNVRITGTWTGSQPAWAAEHINRRAVPLLDVVSDPGFWIGSFRQYALAPGTGDLANAVLLGLPVLAAAVVLARRYRRGRTTAVPSAIIAAMLLLAVAGITAIQALYVTGGGSVNGRYFAVLVLPLSLAVALGLTSWRWAWVVVLAWAAARCLDLVLDVRAVLERYAASGLVSLPPAVAWAGVALFLVGMVGWVLATARHEAAAREPARQPQVAAPGTASVA